MVRRETGKEWSVQVRYDEGVATHIGPKPCIGAREGAGEASVGERIAQQLSHENPVVPDADVFMVTEGDTLGRVIASALKVRRGRRTWHVRKLFVREPGGLEFGLRMDIAGPHREGEESSPVMNELEKSDSAIVVVKLANNAERSAAEPMEPRAGTEGNVDEQSTLRAQDRASMSQALDRMRQVAKERRKERFTTLLHHVDVGMLETALYALKRAAVPGVDGMTWKTYEQDLDRGIKDLHARVHSGAYRALPSRRSYIPKDDGSKRPLAVAALEDKVVQKAVAAVQSEIYEEDFLGFSYGFRPERGQHDALDALIVGISSKKVNFILDADIRSFLTEVSQQWVVRFLEHRIGDPRILRLVQKWLRAGVLEDGIVTVEEKGTGQGSVISPLLSNVYLHYVFDLWAQRWRRREATGDMIMIRYADDIIVGFQHESDARKFWNAMRDRLGEFSLSLHPEKTRLIEFGRFAAQNCKRRGRSKPETFKFLGFVFICDKSRRGDFRIRRKSRGDRMRAKLRELKVGLRRRINRPIPETGKWLASVVAGYFAYHAVPTNAPPLAAFRHHVTILWHWQLSRRSQRAHALWARMAKLADEYLPKPRILHPWPSVRFAARHPR